MNSETVGKEFRLYRSDLGDYMRRWILNTPWGTIRLHHILRSDNDRDMHDHPWDFVSIILPWPLNKHGYHEWTPCSWIGERQKQHQCFKPGSINRKKAEDQHYLTLPHGPVWTLVFTGPKRRDWGFHTSKGWVYWRDYEEVIQE